MAEFGKAGGVGEQLQQKLLKRAETHENWVSAGRDGLVVELLHKLYSSYQPQAGYYVRYIISGIQNRNEAKLLCIAVT